MPLGNDLSFVEITYREKEPEGSPGHGNVSYSVVASSNTFRGEIPSVWFSCENLDDFLRQLDQLNRTRNGSITLSNLSSLSEYNPLVLDIFSIDNSGHLGVKVRLFRLSYDWEEEEALKLSISFPLDNDRFAEVVAGFRKLFN
ncbi:MAG TPA: hypothetical protein VIX17_22510 [Pyrinomonadaceae bacterium]|jgi:hypothetical protein